MTRVSPFVPTRGARPGLSGAMGFALVAALLAPLGAHAQKGPATPTQDLGTESFQPQSGQAGKDVIWVPTPDEIVEALLNLAQVKAGDKLVDLGSGDGKIAIAAAKRGADSRGIEFNPDMVGLSQRNAARAGVDTVRFIQGDIFESDFTDADVITMYLLPGLNQRLRPTLLDMKPGTRVASHQFTMGDWKPDAKQTINGRDALFWVVPAKVGGVWSSAYQAGGSGDLKLTLVQKFQELEAQAAWGATTATVSDVQLVGGNLRFTVADAAGGAHRFNATTGHDGRMSGTVTDAAGQSRPFTAARTTTVGSL